MWFYFFLWIFALSTGEVLTGWRCAGDVWGRLEVHDDGTLVHRGEGKAIVNGCADGEEKSYYFTYGCPTRVSEHQEFRIEIWIYIKKIIITMQKLKDTKCEWKDEKWTWSFWSKIWLGTWIRLIFIVIIPNNLINKTK